MVSRVRVRSRCQLLFFFLLPIVVMVAPLVFVGRKCLAIHTKSHRFNQIIRLEWKLIWKRHQTKFLFCIIVAKMFNFSYITCVNEWVLLNSSV
ncbi:hypothetical protein G4B88_004557 [Cannabis sativa]|uniref:Uncharacterized protein n=1 Tax=Cannabis sativa TaxID=3483 RepID=A0A7J6G784_CANSA|nr:hypothetical protein G4B88_004557 [Cannabis sativa]